MKILNTFRAGLFTRHKSMRLMQDSKSTSLESDFGENFNPSMLDSDNQER